MTFSSRITPQDPFPEHLEILTTDALEILNSKIHRQAELEYRQDGESELETRFRLEFLAEELDRRENVPAAAHVAAQQAAQAPVPAHLTHA
ncbi:hypothetical protein ABIB35_000866 [Arthrobacter sp. UYP6]|uniref:hypothetical protein n=1 Tax=Arthrobacter sp. UYP6 TaxID=1756378 RepID=UPI00339A3DBC